MKQFATNLVDKYINFCVWILDKIGYKVPKLYRNKKMPAVFAVLVPLIIAFISIKLIGAATAEMFAVHLCGVGYHYLVSFLENEKYKKDYERNKMVAANQESNVLSTRCTVVACIGCFTLLLSLLAVLFPERLQFEAVIWICAILDILTNCGLNIVNSLVLWSNAYVLSNKDNNL